MNRKHKLSRSAIGIAVCAFTLSASKEVQLLPAGQFRAKDGRPKDVPHWYIDAALAEIIIAEIARLNNSLVIDYEHQSLLAVSNGQPAPAAAWFKKLEWREADGLYAIDVEWTQRAAAMIEAKEYLYISPVFSYDKKTGAIKSIINAALTNNPALDGMDEVTAQAAATRFSTETQELLTMNLDELLANIRWLLNLPLLATPEEIAAELQKAADVIKNGNPEAAAAGFSLPALLEARNTEIVALRAAAPDPAKYVPIDAMQAVQTELATLRADVNGREVDGLVTAALTDGRLLPPQEAWARGLGGKDIAALKSYLDIAQPVAALSGTQTGGKKPGDSGDGEQLTESQLAVCKAMGVSEDDFKKTLQAQPQG
ncbi:phage protease [Nitrosovibrio sp. Nv4]|uniref:phage protease n=1 Tax=Nitrosovibrio sp. Nv4 TaxID=1945880 RepID=UPI000BC7958D|nr:phage protease [Nitrosovibrio sp. Nv4]SOD42322.1 Mu-like prophage I protein [Nitrosovibrio sp. Nv4]